MATSKTNPNIVIVGCGINGMFAAYTLLKRGYNVTIIDKNKDGLTSKNNAGLLTPSLTATPEIGLKEIIQASTIGYGPIYISPTHILRNLDWFIPTLKHMTGYEEEIIKLGWKSLKLYEQFFKKEKIQADVIHGVAALYSNKGEASKMAKEQNGRFIDEKQISGLGYKNLGGGVMYDKEISINPAKLYDGLKERISEMGATIILGKEAAINFEKGKITNIDAGQKITADNYLITTGSWTNYMLKPLGYNPHVLPARGLTMLFNTQNSRIISAPSLLEDYGLAVSQHDANTVRVTGFFEMVGLNGRFKQSRKDWILEILKKHIKEYKKLHMFKEGYGFRPCTPDQLPIIGKVPGYSNLFVATGQCRLGVTLAPVTAEIVSDLIEERKSAGIHINHLSPERFTK